MNENRMREFKKAQEDLIDNTPGCEGYISSAKKLAGNLENYDLVPAILTKTKAELQGYVKAVAGVDPNPEMAGVMIPINYPNAEGGVDLVAMVLVAADAADIFGFDEETKNHVLTSLFVHELTHVGQLMEMGLEKFASKSFSFSTDADVNAYLNNPLEKGAYGEQNKYLKAKGVDIQFGVAGTEGESVFNCGTCSIVFPVFVD